MANVIYSNARAKALEKNLLNKERLNRIITAESVTDSMKVLSEVGFGNGVTVDNPFDFEKLTDAEEEKLYSFIRNTCPLKAFEDFFMLKNDFDNAEALIKSKYLKIDVDKMLKPFGTIEVNLLKDCIMGDKYDVLPKYLKEALLRTDNDFVLGDANGFNINSYFVKGYYKTAKEIAGKNSDLLAIYMSKVDGINISFALRSSDENEIKNNFIEGGLLSLDKILTIKKLGLEELKKENFGERNEMVKSAVKDYAENKPLVDFEKKLDNIAMSIIKKDKYDQNGIKPYIAYCYYKKAEIENVRIILSLKINSVSVKEIERRVRDGYDG